MSIQDELTLAVRRGLKLRGNTVVLEFQCGEPYAAMQLFEKIQHAIKSTGGIGLGFKEFDEIVEYEDVPHC